VLLSSEMRSKYAKPPFDPGGVICASDAWRPSVRVRELRTPAEIDELHMLISLACGSPATNKHDALKFKNIFCGEAFRESYGNSYLIS